MAKVALLDVLYSQAVPTSSPIDELNHLNRGLGSIKDRLTDGQLKQHGFEVDALDDIVNRQRARAYLRNKSEGVSVLYNQINSPRVDTGSYVTFPYNLDPRLSVPTLIALGELERSRQMDIPFKGDDASFEYKSPIDKLVYLVSQFLAIQPTSRDTRGSPIERELLNAARSFVRAYDEVKREVKLRTYPKNGQLNLALMLAFAATYHKLNLLFTKYPNLFKREFAGDFEFYVEPQIQSLDLSETTESGQSRYIKAAYLDKMSKQKMWELVGK